MNDQREEALRIVNEQAEDDGLWFNAQTASEAYLQQELRRLHAAVERASAREPKALGPSVLEAPQEPVAFDPGGFGHIVRRSARYPKCPEGWTPYYASPQPQAPSSDDARDKRITELEMVTARASFPLPGPIDDTGWVLELLQDGRITVSKAREWLRDYILHGKKGPLPEGPFKEPSVWERAEKAEARVAELETKHVKE